MKAYRVGQKVSWKWASGTVDGKVTEVFVERVERVIKGKKIVRNGTPEKPAYVVQSDSGNFALKLHSELLVGSTKLAGSSLARSLVKKRK